VQRELRKRVLAAPVWRACTGSAGARAGTGRGADQRGVAGGHHLHIGRDGIGEPGGEGRGLCESAAGETYRGERDRTSWGTEFHRVSEDTRVRGDVGESGS